MDLLANELFPFTVALAFMIVTGVMQVIGLDFDIDVDADTNLLGWLGIGRVPFMMLLTLALGIFSMAGYGISLLIPVMFGNPLTIAIAGGASIAGTMFLTPVLAAIIPNDETTSVRLEELVRRRARTTIGTATDTEPAQAKVRDFHGKEHTIWIKAVPGSPQINPNTEVLLVDYDTDTRTFIATPVGSYFRPII